VHLLVAVSPGLATMLKKYSLYSAIALAVLLAVGVVQSVLQPVRDALAHVTSVL
jgi:hypothetical protein